MESSIFKKAGEFLAEKSKHRYWQIAVAGLGIVVIVSTAYVLSKPAQTLVKETYCGMEEHEHTDECYEMTLVCGLEEEGGEEASGGESQNPGESEESPAATESPVPAETPSPTEEPQKEYIEERILACGQDSAHVHTLECYAGIHELVCGLEESEEHSHSESCYSTEVLANALKCGQTESESHSHGEDCYAVVGVKRLICAEPESESHVHGEGCYVLFGDDALICGAGEAVVHSHTEECYGEAAQEPALICGFEETEGHIHGEECYAAVQKQELSCSLEETAGHVHVAECYTAVEKTELTCGTEESEEHQHIDGCYTTAAVDELTCGTEEAEAHEHTAECYTNIEEKELICGTEEAEAHIHVAECYAEAAARELICGLEEGAEIKPAEHVHTFACSQVVQIEVPAAASDPGEGSEAASDPAPESEAAPGEGSEAAPDSAPESEEEPETGSESAQEPGGSEGDLESAEETGAPESSEETAEKHVHTEECYVRTLICETEEHAHADSCYERPFCGIQAHGHHASCYDGEENIICGMEEHAHEENCYKEPHCGFTVHVHRDACYDGEGNAVCGMEEHIHEDACYFEAPTYYCVDRRHTHTEGCMDGNGSAVCGYADFAIHAHSEACYDPNGRLVCPLPEIEEHSHGEECYTPGAEGEEPQLVCGKREALFHEHGADCIGQEGGLICGRTEILIHEHSEDCYVEMEMENEELKVEEQKLVYYCTGRIHVHGEECRDKEGKLVCGYADYVVHAHDEGCYDKAMNLVCPLPEIEAHVHGAECIGEGSELVCGREQRELHEHTPECFDAEKNKVCGKTELLEHKHSEECHVEQPVVVLPEEVTYYCVDRIHAHTEECKDGEGNLVCGLADYVAHVHDEECRDANGLLTCTLPVVEAHVHTEECFGGESEGEEAGPICGKEELHTHTEACRGENESLICGKMELAEHKHSEECYVELPDEIIQTFESERFIVTAKYSWTARIPRDARLIAEEITAESNSEHYAEREAEYQEIMGNKKAAMRALLKVGFYVDGVEIEPETPVTLTVQFLDENGLEEGSPITVVHFGEKGTEVLDGSDAEDGKTTFEMESFSEIGIGYGKAGDIVTVPVSESIEYSTDAFNIRFSIEGEVTVPVSEIEKNNVGNEEGQGSGIQGGEADAAEGTAPEEGSEGGFAVPIEAEKLKGQLEFKVEPLGADSEEYVSAAAYAEQLGSEEDSLQIFDVVSYTLTYNGVELELADCLVKAEITPTQALVEYVEQPVGIATLDVPFDEEGSEVFEIENKVVLMATELTQEAQVSDNSDTMLLEEGAEITPIVLTMTNNENRKNTIAVYATSSKINSHFTVQYYAYLDRVLMGNSGQLEVINTEGGKLPQNQLTQAITRLTLVGDGPKKTVKSERKATEVYAQRDFEYVKAPNIKYFNALIKNASYVLTEIWVNSYPVKCPVPEGTEERRLICGETSSEHNHGSECYVVEEHRHSMANGCYDTEAEFADKIEDGKDGWKKHIYSVLECKQEHAHTSGCYTVQNVHFTNRPETAGEYGYILINEGTILRLTYEPTRSSYDNAGMFYDYDISNGYTEWNGKRNMYTQKYGINSDQNYSGNGTKYAFGNQNCGTDYGKITWNGNYLNMTNSAKAYKGCTFGLVSGVDGEDNVIFSSGIIGPKIFGRKSAVGKYGYDGKLTFARTGDTYTLTGVGGNGFTTLTGLDQFNNPQSGSKPPYYNIWTNNFWPMDSAAKGKDTTFGKAQADGRVDGTRKFNDPNYDSARNLPVSDDGLAHNSFFGMYYAVEFTIPEDYCGPLEYLFFGDDDMWVFLDNKTLVCDIGGVHSSVGEYVNLWDYLRKVDENGNVTVDSGTHTLKFFYTERGASGSTCWMQFTLPSVTDIDPGQNTGALRVEKTVSDKETGEVIEVDDTFRFKLNLTYNGTHLWDDYSYTKYNAENVAIDHDVIVWDGAEFTLKNGEYIIVDYLPVGTEFEIEELGSEKGWFYYTQIKSGNEEQRTDSETAAPKKATGTISTVGSIIEVKYNNLLYVFELPETGGAGTNVYTIAGVIVLLGGASLVYRKKIRERRV